MYTTYVVQNRTKVTKQMTNKINAEQQFHLSVGILIIIKVLLGISVFKPVSIAYRMAILIVISNKGEHDKHFFVQSKSYPICVNLAQLFTPKCMSRSISIIARTPRAVGEGTSHGPQSRNLDSSLFHIMPCSPRPIQLRSPVFFSPRPSPVSIRI
jgi:hypothetical protein